jgi:hypothetical protein
MDLGLPIYELEIELLRIEPKIWRRVLVPGTITLGQLHHVIQIAMGWTDSHLHEFIVGPHSYSDPDFELEDAKTLFSKQFGIRNTNGTKSFSPGLEAVSIGSFSI